MSDTLMAFINLSFFTILEAEREILPLVQSLHEVNTHLPL